MGLCAGGLAAAAYTDVKTREVADELWYALAAAGVALMALGFNEAYGGLSWLLALPVGMVFVVAVTGGEIISLFPGDADPPAEFEPTPRQRLIMRLDIALSLLLIGGALVVFAAAPGLDLGRPAPLLEGPLPRAVAACLMFGAALAFYQFSLISGGADAKALMVLALLFPAAPALGSLPLVHPSAVSLALIPFALAVYFNGAVLLVVARAPVYPLMSWRRGRVRFPESLFGYPKAPSTVNLEREWLLGSVAEGAWVRGTFPRHVTHSPEKQAEALAFLRSRGDELVFVTPKLPFMLYLLAGFLVALALTSPLYFVGG